MYAHAAWVQLFTACAAQMAREQATAAQAGAINSAQQLTVANAEAAAMAKV